MTHEELRMIRAELGLGVAGFALRLGLDDTNGHAKRRMVRLLNGSERISGPLAVAARALLRLRRAGVAI